MGSYYSGALFYQDDDIEHFGVKGMKWGQNIFNSYAEYLRKIGKKPSYTKKKTEESETESSSTTSTYKKPTYTSSSVKVFGDTSTTTTTKKKKKKTAKKTRKTSTKATTKKKKETKKKTVHGGVKTSDLKYAGTGKAKQDVMNFLQNSKK